ncbi:hypothetical protein [Bacillus subtilis]|uniref:hypothetical protein n=1 Tax=Bacillus subtilis TaxID=1423 RepID=UPI0015E7D005|nr:hypothetical protein [Bacillus subtilis]
MAIDFAKLNNPEWKKQWLEEEKERERLLEEQETLRKKTVCFTVTDQINWVAMI